jgi:hypothetical protein
MLPLVAKVASLIIALLVIAPPLALANPPDMDKLAKGIWVDRQAIKTLPMTAPAWDKLKADADRTLGTPNLANQDDMTNVWVLAKALVYVRTGDPAYRDAVIAACMAAIGTEAGGETLALGRELAAYVIAANLVILPPEEDARFRSWLGSVTNLTMKDGRTLKQCHEQRPNNWGTMAGASRLAVAAYLGDEIDFARAATVFKGYLGDRSSYAGFKYGALDWQADPTQPVGINPQDAKRDGHSIDGVLPEEQRRSDVAGGAFYWPPPQEGYVWEGLQGAIAQAVILRRAGYPVLDWENQALLRAYRWLHEQANFPAEGDDTWQPYLVNALYQTNFPTTPPSQPGKNVGYTDWTHTPLPAPQGLRLIEPGTSSE